MLCYVLLCYVMLCYVMLCYVMLCYVLLCYVMLCYVMLCYVMLCYVMLCYVMLCYVMLCYVMLCYVMLCYVMLCYVMLCYVMLCYVMLCYVMLCCAVLCCAVLCCVVLCCAVLYCIVLYCIVLYILYCTLLCFVFDDTDDILETWEKLFNDAVDTHCPWREKRVKRPNQAPWMTKGILEQLRLRDTLLKSARKSKNPDDWELYKRARNELVNMIKTAKYKFYSNCFEEKCGQQSQKNVVNNQVVNRQWQHYSDWVCTAVMSNDVMKDLRG